MKNLLNSQERRELISRLKLKRQLNRRAARRFPSAFRRQLKLTSDSRQTLAGMLQPWQEADFGALDAAWRQLAGYDDSPAFLRAYVERPRGHAKTSDTAVQLAWILQNAQRRVEGLAAAADREQAALLRDAVFRLAEHNPEYCADLSFTRFEVRNGRTGSRLSVIASDVQSSWGALPDFIICDELCHWEKPDMWYSLFSSAAKQRHCILVVLTNAGVGRGWHWEVREAARRSSQWYFSSLEGTQAPWIEATHLQEQRQLLPPAVFDRLWHNRWQHSDGEFVTLAEAQACRDDSLSPQQQGQPGRRYFAAVDYAEKHDYTVGVVLHREAERLVIDRMDVIVPQPDSPVPIVWVEEWMQRIAAGFHSVSFVLDEYQLLGTLQRFENCFDIRRFEFAGGKGNHALAVTLRRLIVQRQLAWFPDCGAVPDETGTNNLETELASLLLRQSPSGYCRITHHTDGRHHDDRAFALGAACLLALREAPDTDWLHITPPTALGHFRL